MREDSADKLANWLKRELGATVVHMERMPRWRPMWMARIDCASGSRSLVLRGDRPPDTTPPFPLTYERKVHDLLEAHGIPVPHVHGYCEDPPCLIMDQAAGRFNLATARDETERRGVLAHYIEILARLHAIPLEACAAAGIAIPAAAREGILGVFSHIEAGYEAVKDHADPLCEFGRRWVHRNARDNDVALAMTTYDAGQFLFDDGRVTALLDLELAHVTDRHADLAALLLRDTVEPMGDLCPAFEQYRHLTGNRIDPDAIDFHVVSWAMVTPMFLHRFLERPASESDFMTYQTWYVDNAAWALETMARLSEAQLTPLDAPTPRHSPHRAAHEHLETLLQSQQELSGYAKAQARQAYRLARHLKRVDEIGAQLEDDNISEIEDLTGTRCGDSEFARQALENYVCAAPPSEDKVLIPLLHRMVQRHHMLLGPAGSRICHHPPLQCPHRSTDAANEYSREENA